MVETITPVVYGGNTRKWLVGVAMMVIGGTVVAGAFGALLGLTGAAFGAPWGVIGLASVALLALAYVARETLGLPIPVLAARRQVPEWWRTFFSPNIAALLYGAGLGVGFFTYLTYGTLVVVAATAVALGQPLIGVLLMAPFGFARTATVLIARDANSSETVWALVTRLAGLGATNVVKIVHITALVLLAINAVATVYAIGVPPKSMMAANLGAFAAAIIAMVFAWTGITKLVGLAAWRQALVGYELPARAQSLIAWSVPLAEIAVALLAIIGLLPLASAAAVILLAAFSIAIVRAHSLRGEQLACGCFGSRKHRDYRVLLLRNGLLAMLALTGVVWAPSASARMSEVAIAPLVLSIVGVALIAWVLRITTRALRGDRT